MASVIAKQDIHWDRIPVDGNSMRFQFRCLVQSSEDCTSWQNPMSFKRHMEKIHNMQPEATRRGRPPTKNNNGKGRSPAKTNDGKSRICSENLTDRSSGNYPYKWWIRKKYQLGLLVRKIAKQMQLLKGIQEESKVIHKALECYGRWRVSEKAIAIQKKLAESTMAYWMDKGLDKEEAGVKGKIPLHLQQEGNMKNTRVAREPEPDVVYVGGGYKIIRRKPPVNEEEHEEGDSESDEDADGKEASEMIGVTENGSISKDAGELEDAGEEQDEVDEKAAGEEEKICKEADAGEGKNACDEEKTCEGKDAGAEKKTCEKEDPGEGKDACDEEKTCEGKDAGAEKKTCEKEDAGEGNNAYEDLDLISSDEETSRVERLKHAEVTVTERISSTVSNPLSSPSLRVRPDNVTKDAGKRKSGNNGPV